MQPHCTADKIEDLNLQSWTLCQGAQVQEKAHVWLNTTTKSGCKAQAQSIGLWWTPLHHLPYWDPVKHVLLGYAQLAVRSIETSTPCPVGYWATRWISE